MNRISKRGIINEGRPTKYDESFIKMVDEYILTTGREQTSLPTVEGLAHYLDTSREAVNRWTKKHKAFRIALRRLKTIQGEQLINDGIYGGKEINPTIVKLLLMNNHGMRERKDVTSDNEKIEPMVIYKPEKNR